MLSIKLIKKPQVSGQGPYYGQAAWFNKFAPEKIPYAIDRYTSEVNRVTSVLEGHLSAQKEANGSSDGPWLVGNKFSYADLAFVSWQITIPKMTEGDGYSIDKFPLVKAWIGRMSGRKGIASVLAEMEKGQAKGH